MSEDNSEVSRVRVVGTPLERRPTLIDGTIKKVELTRDSFSVEVGNTGLSLRFLKDVSGKFEVLGDFKPGGYIGLPHQEPIAEKDAIKMFAYSMMSFLYWAKEESGLEPWQINGLRGLTNKNFSKFLADFFTKNNHAELFEGNKITGGEQIDIHINLGKLLALEDDDPFIKKIIAMGKRAEGAIVPALIKVE